MALQLAEAELLFPAVWPAAARRVLPSESPEVPAASLWAPVLACCAVMLFSESLYPGGRQENAWEVASDVFERLRLRQPMAESFEAVGLEGEQCWRAAARVRLALLQRDVPHKADGETVAAASELWMGLSRASWSDPEVRWLVGWNEWQEHLYIAKDAYEELLWWLLLPQLCRLTGRKADDRKLAVSLQAGIQKACEGMAELHYTVDAVASDKPEGSDAKAAAKTMVVKPTKDAGPAKTATTEDPASKRGSSRRSKKKARKHKKKPKK
jgi:hypothetical protein